MALIKNPRLVAHDEKGETSMPALQLLQEDQEKLVLPLADLHSLKEVVKGAGAFAMREIDFNHVETLSCTDPQLWPPICVTKTNGGYVYYDGQHRMQAAKLLKAETIQATCKTFPDVNALVEAAFRANLRHGLPASKETRADYCYWLSITFSNLSQRQIAARVGVTQSAVSQAIERRKKLLEEAVQQARGEEGTSQEGNDEEWREGVVKRVKTFIRSVSKFSETDKESEGYSELIRELQYELLQVPEDRQALLFAGQLLLDAANRSKARKAKA
jgi:predicted transcriptional regulator